jgi:hypothetical protein
MKKFVISFITLLLAICLSVECCAYSYSMDAVARCTAAVTGITFNNDKSMTVSVTVENNHGSGVTEYTIDTAVLIVGNCKFSFSGAIKNLKIAAKASKTYNVRISAKKVAESLTDNVFARCEYALQYSYKIDGSVHSVYETTTTAALASETLEVADE